MSFFSLVSLILFSLFSTIAVLLPILLKKLSGLSILQKNDASLFRKSRLFLYFGMAASSFIFINLLGFVLLRNYGTPEGEIFIKMLPFNNYFIATLCAFLLFSTILQKFDKSKKFIYFRYFLCGLMISLSTLNNHTVMASISTISRELLSQHKVMLFFIKVNILAMVYLLILSSLFMSKIVAFMSTENDIFINKIQVFCRYFSMFIVILLLLILISNLIH